MFYPRQIIILATVLTLTVAQNFDLDCTNALDTCNNMCYAINCKGSPTLLTYDSNNANRGPRRTASGCNRTPCTNTHYSSFGNSCDEYPFASTTQGGTGAIMRCVDSSESSSEQGQLGNFYRGVPNGHQFSVVFRNFGGAGFCENAQNCANDGGEFRLVNGQFVNGKRTDKIFSFVSADSNSNVGTPFRKFMGSDGIERLWFNEGSTGTIVGHYVWDGMNEKVLITSETTKVGGMSTVHLLFDL